MSSLFALEDKVYGIQFQFARYQGAGTVCTCIFHVRLIFVPVFEIVNTNLLGSMLCTRHAINLMKKQNSGGHVFNTEGAGSDFSTTPNYAAYGATKAAITQLTNSLQCESKECKPIVGVHTIQPGMVLTNLLLDGATLKNKQAFNILCEQPETVAAFLVPRMRTVVARKSRSSRVTYLTRMRALEK